MESIAIPKPGMPVRPGLATTYPQLDLAGAPGHQGCFVEPFFLHMVLITI